VPETYKSSGNYANKISSRSKPNKDKYWKTHIVGGKKKSKTYQKLHAEAQAVAELSPDNRKVEDHKINFIDNDDKNKILEPIEPIEPTKNKEEVNNVEANKIAPVMPSIMKRLETTLEVNKVQKHVTFAEKLITNEDSLDSEMLERIKHNLEYNDDRIFEGLSIFDLKSEEEQASQMKEVKENNEDLQEEKKEGKLLESLYGI